jgi:hypothetical protein
MYIIRLHRLNQILCVDLVPSFDRQVILHYCILLHLSFYDVSITKSAALLLRSELVSSGNGVEILDICPIHIQASLDREMKALMRKRIIFLITVFGLLFVGGTALALNSPSID